MAISNCKTPCNQNFSSEIVKMKFFLSTLLVVAIAVAATQGRKSREEWHKFKVNYRDIVHNYPIP